MDLEAFRRVRKGTLRGFCRLRHTWFILDEISIHVGGDDGSASPPTRPMLDANGVAMRDPRTGKTKYAGLIAFPTAAIRRRWSDEVIALVRDKHPEVFADDAEGGR